MLQRELAVGSYGSHRCLLSSQTVDGCLVVSSGSGFSSTSGSRSTLSAQADARIMTAAMARIGIPLSYWRLCDAATERVHSQAF